MTDRQRTRFYFPAWAAAAAANRWRMETRRLVIEPERLSELGRKVVAEARARAAKEFRGPTLRDLRRGAHVVALGRDKSAKDLTQAELKHVLSVFKLLKDEMDLDASMRLDHPEIGEREGAQAAIKKLDFRHRYIDTLCRRMFAPVYDPPFWEDLPVAKLRALFGLLKERRAETERGRSPPAALPLLPAGCDQGTGRAPELDPANAPF